MLMHDGLQTVPAQHADGRVGHGLRARRAWLLIEDRHLPHHVSRAMPGKRHLATAMVEMDADLTVDDHVKLRTDVTTPKHRVTVHVMTGHHEAVDARQLLQR